MSSPANDVVQATCPGCKNSLRIPGNWIGQSMKCKHCGMVFQAKASDKPRKKKKKGGLLERAARVTRLALSKIPRRKKKKKKHHHGEAPQAKPYAPPAAIPLGPGGPAPAALPVAGLAPGSLPAALPVGAVQAGPLPAALPIPSNGATQLASLPYEPVRRRGRGKVQKIAFLMIFFLVAGCMAGLIYMVSTGEIKPPSQLAEVGLGGNMDSVTGTSKTPDTASFLAPSTYRPPITKDPGTGTKAPVAKDTGTRPPIGGQTSKSPIVKDTGRGPIGTPPPVNTVGNFPRRMLAVIPANYAFAAPVGYGNAARSLNNVVPQLGDILRIPAPQIAVLSDRAATPMPPIKEMIISNVSAFLASCKPQDRVVLLFVGHGVEVNDKPYIMPLEGEKDNADNLIPLEWVFGELQKCPARQKIFIADVCRFDPQRGEERGSVARMGEKFDAMLKTPPAGIQVLTACVTGEYSYEVPGNTGGSEFEGGVMLSQIPTLKLSGGLKGLVQKPEDSIPIEALTATLTARTGAFARTLLKTTQTVRLTGTEMESPLVYDSKLPLSAPFQPALSGIFLKGVASRSDIESLFKAVAGIPPTKRSDSVGTISFDSLPPYPKDKVAALFKDDGGAGTSPLREKVKEAVDLLKQNNQQLQEFFPRNFDPGNQQQANNFKNQIGQIQMNAGLVQFKLDTILEELDAMQADRAKEPKLWQANYDYVRARLSAKIAYVYEYNAKLGEMRKDFPTIDPMIHKGWQLVAKEKISDRDADKYAKKGKQYLETLGKETVGTPWELFAKREKITALGLDWQPAPK